MRMESLRAMQKKPEYSETHLGWIKSGIFQNIDFTQIGEVNNGNFISSHHQGAVTELLET